MPVSDLEAVLRNGVRRAGLDRAPPPRRQLAPHGSRRDPPVPHRGQRSGRAAPGDARGRSGRRLHGDDQLQGRRSGRADRAAWIASPTPTATSRSGRATRTSVTSTDREGRTSAPSRRLSLAIIAVPEAPVDVQAVPGEREVQPVVAAAHAPHRRRPGRDPVIYEILRATGPDGPARRREPYRAGVTTALDVAIWRTIACTTTRSGPCVGRARLAAEGRVGPSVVATATPEDARRRGRPRALVALPRRVEHPALVDAVPDADVAGYVVYRAERADGPRERVGSVRAPARRTSIRDVAPGRLPLRGHRAGLPACAPTRASAQRGDRHRALMGRPRLDSPGKHATVTPA